MNIIPKPLCEATLVTNAAATLYTATSLRAQIQSITVCNPNATAYLLTLYIIASGGSASATNTMVYQRTILAGQTLDLIASGIIGIQNLANGDFVQVLADTTNKLSIRMSGIEVPI